MEDWVFRRDLIDPRRRKALSARSDARGALQAARHFAAIAATGLGLFLTWGTPWCIPLFILHGMLLNHLYAAQHELVHRTAFRTRWLMRTRYHADRRLFPGVPFHALPRLHQARGVS